MAEDQSRYWSPSRTYEFELKIGKIDLTPDLISVRVFTTLDNPYQTFILDLFLDSSQIILEKIYGQTPLKLTSKLFGTADYIPQEQIEFELMYLASDMPLDVSAPLQSNITQRDRDPVSIVCVARKAYTTMNTLVNSVYQGQSMASVIGDLVNSQAGAKLKMDSQGINTSDIDQILIPSSTLYKNLLYLNRTFGIYNGMAGIFCTYDNYVTIKNLTNKMKSSETFILYQLPLGEDNTEVIKKCTDGKRFYTLDNLQTRYKGNSAFAYMAPTIKHVVKPKDRLYHTITTSLDSFSKEYGLISKGNKMFFDSGAMPTDSRVSFHKDHTGYELDETFIRAKYSRRVALITEMNVHVERALRITNLMNIGEAVKLDTKIDISRDFTGLYILKSSMLNFTRGKDWESSADLTLIRTNRTTT